MNNAIHKLIGRASAGENLTQDEMATAIDGILRGDWSDAEIAMLLTALHHKGPTVDEIAGAALAMRRHMTAIRTSREGVIDTCGTGGDASGTFNISTAAAIVTAAAGVPVAKHGNRRATSRSGSADVLEALGVNVNADVPRVEACLDRLGICFCFAPLVHGAMKRVAEVRRQLGMPTIFNLLGPLTNPAAAPFQLLGVGRAELRPLLAEALRRLGVRRALVVRGDDGLDEITLAGPTRATEIAGNTLTERTIEPADFGLVVASLDCMKIDGPEPSAAMIRDILAGRHGPPHDIVVANAAAAVWIAGRAESLTAGAKLATEAIDSGAANDLLRKLAEMSNN
ncbi:MAG TPA: anthranilate phosphoribosyltransferase [Pirellulales bacterium]|jgi:anthranilate phosphoribosyltransferase|nr:anthranilate phosphoribosyltransferase [Pirellulales bacterium]